MGFRHVFMLGSEDNRTILFEKFGTTPYWFL